MTTTPVFSTSAPKPAPPAGAASHKIEVLKASYSSQQPLADLASSLERLAGTVKRMRSVALEGDAELVNQYATEARLHARRVRAALEPAMSGELFAIIAGGGETK